MVNFKYKTKWDLNSYYSRLNDENFENDISKIIPLANSFSKKYKNKIENFKVGDFLKYFKDEDEFSKHINKIGLYLNYISALDTQDQNIIKKEAEFENILTEVSNMLLFSSQEFKKIGYEKLMKLSKNKKLKEYENYFHQKAINIKYLLDEKTEFALNLKENSGSGAFAKMYSELTNSFVFKVHINGKVKEMTDAEVRALRMSTDEKTRKESLRSIKNVYNDKKIQITLGNTYSSIVKDWISEIKIRGFKDVMSQRNLSEELDDDVVNMLLEEVEKAYPLYHRYLKIKAKLLGKKKLKSWDLYAPVSKKEKEFNFNESLEIFLDTMKEFDDEFYKYSKDMFEKGRVDVFVKKGKRGGAFASYEKDFESYVLLNHTNKLTDVLTLAHELGHAMHGHLSQKQNAHVYESPLSLAETASIFNEILVSEFLMKKLSDKEKLVFLEHKLSDIFATIFRQVQYVLFEKKVHKTLHSGKELTYVDFNKMWRKEQEKMTANMLQYDTTPEEETSWSMIPHIFISPFYCYTYAFGNLLTFALFKKYKEEGKKFVNTYKNILKAGGSIRPYELLKENGFDIKSREYYKNGLKVIEDMVIEFEKLT